MANVFLPLNMIPDWWRWFAYADFAMHLVRAITVDQFWCDASVNPYCPTITVSLQGGAVVLPTYDWMSHNVVSCESYSVRQV